MRILINCSNLVAGGGIQVAHSFISYLKVKSDDFYVVMSYSLSQLIDRSSFPPNIHFFDYTIKPTLFKAFIGRDLFLDSFLEEHLIDKVFTVFGPSYWNPNKPHLVGFAKPKYIYKESPYIKNLGFWGKYKVWQKEIIDLFNFKYFSDCLVTESEDVSYRLGVRLKFKKILTVSNIYNQVFDNQEFWEKVDNFKKFDGITLLTISSYYYHKNFEIIPKVIEYLKEKHPDLTFRFILTIEKRWFSHVPNSILDYIEFLGKVRIAQCPWLYKHSTVMFHPSFLECFSAAYPEAMKMEVPILASDLGFARGICGEAAYYFDPVSAESAGEAIYRLAKDSGLRQKLIEAGIKRLKTFDTAESRAEKYLNILKTLG